jgi:hypothetical protein
LGWRRPEAVVERCIALGGWRFFFFFSLAGLAWAQQTAPSEPQVPSNNDSKPSTSDQLTNDRIFGVIPNYRTVEDPTQGIAPLSAKQKIQDRCW